MGKYINDGLMKGLHEIVGMAHAGGIVSQETEIQELFIKIETLLDEIIGGLENCTSNESMDSSNGLISG